MRKFLTILCMLMLALPLVAQQRAGNIYVTVVDNEQNALPGVTITVSGLRTGAMTQITNASGNARFMSLSPGRDYMIKAELQSFKTEIRENIIVEVGANIALEIVMQMGALSEEITVTAVTPVVDQKKTSVGTNVTQDVLQSLPTARDPWVILQMAPSVIVDRENIGGAESGQQSNYVGRGASSYNNNVWAMDGVVITDPAAIGASPTYYDFDAFEEMQITVGGADVTVQTGGIALNMVTRRGGNKVSLGGRFYLTDSKFQELNEEYVAGLIAEEQAAGRTQFRGVNKIRNNKDFGFNLGVPLWPDKAWFWGSYGVQDIKTTTVYGTPDDTLLQNYAAKLNLQIIPENRFEAFIHSGAKSKYGRSASASLPDGYIQGGRYHFGSPIVKFQDEHMFGENLFLSVKYAFSDAGFNLTPVMDPEFDDVPVWDYTDQRWYGSEWRYYVERPVNQYNVLANLFLDNVLGASHEWKFGFEMADRNAYTESVYSGNMLYRRNYISATVDMDGDGIQDFVKGMKRFEFWRGYFSDLGVSAFAGYISDTATFGRFNVLLGLRYDSQSPKVNPVNISAVQSGSKAWNKIADSAVQAKLDALLPGVDISEIKGVDKDGKAYSWQVWSPRIGFTWDVMGDGKTIAKLALATYGDFMGVGEAGRWMPGGASGWLDFWWMDSVAGYGNNDGMVQLNERYWYHYRTGATYTPYPVFDGAGNFIGNWTSEAGAFWGSYDYANPSALRDPYQQIDANAGSSRTSEAMITLEREILTDFAAQMNITYRKYDNYNWGLKYFPADVYTGVLSGAVQNQSWYTSAGAPPGTLPGVGNTGEAGQHEWYYMATPYTSYSPYSWVQKRPDYYTDYWGVDLIFNKRLSNKWMLNSNFTWQTQAAHYGDKGLMEDTNRWAFEGQPNVAYIGGASGKINQYTYSRWLAKVGWLYQLPFDINFGGTFMAREGWIIRETFGFVNYTLPNPASRSNTLYMSTFGSERLPVFANLTVRLEKMLRLGDTGRIYLMFDLFNALNNKVVNRRYQKDWGTVYYYGAGNANNYLSPQRNYNALNEILNPRVFRLGVRFTF
ncbi:MAG: carboxypeptidase regulatory-like domain-containing protein [Acidobacteriota bacterium]